MRPGGPWAFERRLARAAGLRRQPGCAEHQSGRPRRSARVAATLPGSARVRPDGLAGRSGSRLGGSGLTAELRARYHPHPYLHDMVHALVAADLVVARAGAATLGEFPGGTAARHPGAVPICRTAPGSQRRLSGRTGERQWSFRTENSSTRLKTTVLDLLDRPERLETMAAASAALARPDAADNIADELLRMTGKWPCRSMRT